MPDSSEEHLPISEDPTIDGLSVEGDACQGEDSGDFHWSDSRHEKDNVPQQIGDYELGELIGSGGMGNVYLAKHTRMQRTVAIKMLPIERMNNAEAVERFYGEVRAASRLLHPNIVTAFDAGHVPTEEFGDIHYLAMEYVDGMTLTQAVSRSGPMTIGEAASAIRQAAIGLLHAHRAGIIHRDVKPGNLMRSDDGTVKVLDLGLARIHSSVIGSWQGEQESDDQDNTDDNNASVSDDPTSHDPTRQRGRLVGTLAFMSPEQLEDPDSADSRSDIYSLGATLYFLLTATPPYAGEYLDQVYGHRHGEIPDLMEARTDIDRNFADIFSRMMAKSPSQRYESLDEVIDALGDYAGETDSPQWLVEFNQRHAVGDASTFSGGSTSGGTARVLGIDLGMHYSAAAEATPTGENRSLNAGHGNHSLFRMAIGEEGGRWLFDQDAAERRSLAPQSVVHCLPLYIGQPVIARTLAEKQCPPEVLMAMMMRKMLSQSWGSGALPHATAITVPSSYDQLRRRYVLQAAQMAGLTSVRLVDRSIAAVHSLWINDSDSIMEDITGNVAQNILFIGVTGQATEVALIRGEPSRMQQLATAGHWRGGTLPWLRRLVSLANESFQQQHSLDPAGNPRMAASLQIACEKAMNSMFLMPAATIGIDVGAQEKSVQIQRQLWLEHCSDLRDSIGVAIDRVCTEAQVPLQKIHRCVTLGAILRMPSVKAKLLGNLPQDTIITSVDRNDVARGAAACLAAELPGRGDIAMPPGCVTSQTIGIVIEDAKGRRRILPLIPRGTSLPARTNRRLSVSDARTSMTVSLVESSGVDRDQWQTLGRYDIDVGSANGTKRSRTISFEVNTNGLLTVRAPMPIANSDRSPSSVSTSTKLPPLPKPNLTDDEMAEWKKWIETIG